jgi:PAS domain S-box-containing protein
VTRPGAVSERAVILAPTGRDGHLASLILAESGRSATICADLPELAQELDRGAGLAVIADEAVHTADLRPLVAFLEQQPPWADLPIILLTHRGGGPERNPAAVRLAEALGNVTFLERPFHPTTLTTVARAAVRARRRQYEARARLEDLVEGEQQLQTALHAGRLGSWTLAARGRILNASESCRSHFGHPPDVQFSDRDLQRATHPDDVARVQHALDLALQAGADYAIEYRTVWPDGSVHWVDMRARAVRNTIGEVAQLVGVSSDITARKTSELEREHILRELAAERAALSDLTRTLEQRVQQRTAELTAEVAARERAQEQLLQSQKMESLGQLTGGIAHDFNNLLMAVMGNLELLRKQLPANDRMRRLVDGALQGAERGATLTQRMLAFARQQELRTSSSDIASLLEGMQDLLTRSLGPHIALHMHIDPDLPPAQVDAHQIELAILNLAINARDAMPDGGAIDISADQAACDVESSLPGGEIDLPSGSYLRIKVADTGAGMDPITLKRAIEPFFSSKPLGKGTGLGLSMVHGLAVQLGGTLDLTSEVGKGTIATLWLPIATHPPVAAQPRITEPAVTQTVTILVVDDDPLVAMSTVGMLEDLGHTVIEANSARQALEVLEAGQQVDLMMTDHAMPGMTGVELAKIALGKRPDLPVLLATGYADLPAGQTPDLPRLTKPYQQAQLRAEIERLLERAL